MSIVALWIVNSFPRRRLLFIGITGQIVGFAIAAAALLAPATVSTAYGWVMVRSRRYRLHFSACSSDSRVRSHIRFLACSFL